MRAHVFRPPGKGGSPWRRLRVRRRPGVRSLVLGERAYSAVTEPQPRIEEHTCGPRCFALNQTHNRGGNHVGRAFYNTGKYASAPIPHRPTGLREMRMYPSSPQNSDHEFLIVQ